MALGCLVEMSFLVCVPAQNRGETNSKSLGQKGLFSIKMGYLVRAQIPFSLNNVRGECEKNASMREEHSCNKTVNPSAVPSKQRGGADEHCAGQHLLMQWAGNASSPMTCSFTPWLSVSPASLNRTSGGIQIACNSVLSVRGAEVVNNNPFSYLIHASLWHLLC